MAKLDAAGFQTRPGTHAVHRLGYYVNKYGLKSEQFPNACIAEETTITLPIIPDMQADTQEGIAKVLKAAIKS